MRCLGLCKQQPWGPPKKIYSVETFLSRALTRKMAGSQQPKPNNCQMAGERKINVEQSRRLNSYFRAVEGLLYGHFDWSIRACLNQRICPFLTPHAWATEAWGSSLNHLPLWLCSLGPGPPSVSIRFQMLIRNLCKSQRIRDASWNSCYSCSPFVELQSYLSSYAEMCFSSSQGLFDDICLFP